MLLVPEAAVRLVQQVTENWTPETLRAQIQSGTVPQQYLDLTMDYLLRNKGLIARQREDFLLACQAARPTLYPILDTPEGRRWLTAVGDELGRQLPRQLLRTLANGARIAVTGGRGGSAV